MEIGSEFWLNSMPEKSFKELPNWLKKFGNTVLTSSGRGAITLLLKQIQPTNKSVLLPAYICESVILPFLEQGYSCHYYEVNENLIPNLDSINSFKNIGVFLHMGYYGFSTNSNLEDVLQNLSAQSTIIIEDITHTMFSSYERYENNDFYMGSIRKWVGIPSGGFLSSAATMNENDLLENSAFSAKRLEALINKGKYIKTNKIELKEIALNQFSEAEDWLDRDAIPHRIDELSANIVGALNEEELITRRKENFINLSNGMKTIDFIHPIFEELDERVCPMFFPVLIKGKRQHIKKKLTEESIYCPIHWPIPEQIEINELNITSNIYNCILSIPCDQRYGVEDMDRIISVLKSIQQF